METIFFSKYGQFFSIFRKKYKFFFGFKNIPYDSFWAACFLSFFSFIQRNVLMLINNGFYTRLGPRGTRQKMLIAILCRNVCFYISKYKKNISVHNMIIQHKLLSRKINYNLLSIDMSIIT